MPVSVPEKLHTNHLACTKEGSTCAIISLTFNSLQIPEPDIDAYAGVHDGPLITGVYVPLAQGTQFSVWTSRNWPALQEGGISVHFGVGVPVSGMRHCFFRNSICTQGGNCSASAICHAGAVMPRRSCYQPHDAASRG